LAKRANSESAITKRQAGRRSNSEGSISQRQDKLWEGRITLPGGRRRSFYAKTKAEALEKIRTAQRQVAEGRPLGPERLTVGGWLEQWLENTVSVTTRPTTAKRYGELCRFHIIPSLGNLRLTRLGVGDVERMTREAMERGVSPRTAHHCRAVLRAALGAAERHSLVGRNVASLAAPPKVPELDYVSITPTLARQIMGAVQGDTHEALYVLLLGTGLRLGEATGLAWTDLDFDSSVITVRHSLRRVKGGFQLTEPKTPKARRVVPMVAPVREALKALQLRQNLERMMQGGAWEGAAWGGLVFTTERGGPLGGDIAYAHFRRVLRRAGIPAIRLHDLRHGAASLLAAAGIPPRDVMELLGHSQISTTLTVYTHSTPEARHEAMGALGRILWGKPSE
jgi:integrase